MGRLCLDSRVTSRVGVRVVRVVRVRSCVLMVVNRTPKL